MSSLLTDHREADDWAEHIIAEHRARGIFGKFSVGVVWTEEGNPLADQGIQFDPYEHVSQLNIYGQPLFLNHDPGRPVGRVIAGEVFESHDGRKFIGAVLGYYDGVEHGGFSDFVFDFSADPGAPRELPELADDDWIEIATDPRDVDRSWVIDAAEEAPLKVKRRSVSYNAAEAAAEVIRVAVPYLALIWNPLVTTIATKAGEDTYKAMRKWQERLFRKFSEHKNPIIALQAVLSDCDITFIVRGNDLDILMAASAGLEAAASQAHHLVQALRRQNAPLRALFYEFDPERKAWIPSYAELRDGRFITDNRTLILAENLPKGLSLGLGGVVDGE